MRLDIKNNISEKKFFVIISGEEIALNYDITNDGVIILLDLVIPPKMQGTGYAVELIEYAFAYADDHRFQVKIMCDYIKRYYKIQHKLKKALKLI